MKVIIALFLSVAVVTTVGCDDGEKKVDAPKSQFDSELEVTSSLRNLPDGTYSEYEFRPQRFHSSDCTTGPRVSLNMEQFCRQLQSDAINNDCAPRQRRRTFTNECSGQVWDPLAVEQELQSNPGAHITCYASDPSEDGLQDKRNNPEKYENDEHFVDRISAIKYRDFVAFVFMELKDGLFLVKIRAFDEGSGQLIAETQKSWKDQMPDEIVLESLPGRVRVLCLPTIR